ncbi:MAG: leucyl aminopeptidase [Bacteroidota bacterium]|nr:leucyl aminopeptidase [Bacteroidota bacterium]
MKINVQKANWKTFRTDSVVFFQPEDKKWLENSLQYYGKNTPLHGQASQMIASGDMSGKKDEQIVLYPASGEVTPKRIVLIGLGKPDKISLEQVRRAAARAVKKAQTLKSKTIAMYLPRVGKNSGEIVAAAAVEGILLGLYKFDRFFKKEEPVTPIETITFLTDDGKIFGSTVAQVAKAVQRAELISQATIFARDMENEPSNNKFPETLAKWASEAGRKSGFKVTAFGPAELRKNKMVGILAVNQGSVKEARFIIMEYKGSKKADSKPIVLVGKGITFDTGGISIKPAAGMGDMKSDMSGAATVIATLKAVAELKLPINVIGLVSSAENMPSGSATRPGDIITYANGLSAEIDNTDAEGRLVLADALIWAQKYNPKSVIDLATLTGACVVALGHVTTGMMGTDEAMKKQLKKIGDEVYERVCELPIYEEYEELIKSDVADIKNVGGRWAGAITAALFLKRFTDYPWIHLDIAGTARSEAASDYIPKGGTGVAVRLLTHMLIEESGKK